MESGAWEQGQEVGFPGVGAGKDMNLGGRRLSVHLHNQRALHAI